VSPNVETPSSNNHLINVLLVVLIVVMLVGVGVAGVIVDRLKVAPSDVYSKVSSIETILEEGDVRYQQALQALESTGAAVVELDSSGLINFWSKGASELFGVTSRNAKGFGIAFLIPPGMREGHKLKFSSTMESESVEPFHHIVRCNALHSDGTEFPIILNIWAVPGHSALAIFEPNLESISEELL